MHVLTRPLSEYLRFEFSRYYAPHVLAGEDIRILDVTERENPLPEVGDFWMLDRSTVVLLHYEVDGTQISRELYEGDPAPFVEWQRDLRGQAGLSGDRLAARRNMSQSKVSRIENGRTRPYLVDVEQILRALDAPPALVAEVSALARMANTEWRSLRELRRKGLGTRQAELKSLEASSTRMRYFLLSMATGLLATPEYVRASLAHSTADTSKAVAGKLRRQAVLYDASKRFTFVLTERAVRWPVVSPLALAEQMDRLASLSHLPNVQIGVIPPGCPSSLGMWLARVPWSNCTFDSSWLMQALIDSKYAEVTAAGLAANELIETCAALTKINREITEAQRSECLTHLSALKSLYTRRNQLIHGLWAPAGMRTDQDEPAPTPHRLAGGPSARRTAAQAPADGFALGLSRYADTVGSPAR